MSDSILAQIVFHKDDGKTWEQIGALVGLSAESARWRWRQRNAKSRRPLDEAVKDKAEGRATNQRSFELGVDLEKVQTLEELVAALEVDSEEWSVGGFRGTAWDAQVKGGERRTFFSVKAHFERNRAAQYRAAEAALLLASEDMEAHSPLGYYGLTRDVIPASDPSLFVLAIMDPHLGMLAWKRETGNDYDLNIALRDHEEAVDNLLPLARLYPTRRILIVGGNDMQHADATEFGGKGGRTRAGTAQDMDTRLAKIFTAARRALVSQIDKARLIAPVDVVLVPGNHDHEQTYRLGEVLWAWYRHDPEVQIYYGPQKRHFYEFGKNGFMLTHGEEYARQRDNLPTIFATEAPADLWSRTTYREILTGHNHRKLEGRYLPTFDADEHRAIRVRSLPGLTATDAWHAENGYKHVRAATALAYRSSGGLAGMHEFTL